MPDIGYEAALMPPPYDPAVGSESIRPPAADQPIIKRLAAWFIATHTLGLIVAPIYVWVTLSWATLATFALAALLWLACHLSITDGAHRLDSHKAFKARMAYELFVTLFFPATFEYPRKVWAYFHRLHHAFTDTAWDPYSARFGFWWAQMGWILRTPAKIPVADEHRIRDLLDNPWIRVESHFYWPFAFGIGFVLPTALAALWGDALGGLLVAGCTRLVVQIHTTGAINSIAHTFGRQPYGPISSARANRWLSEPTVGEGVNHAKHHLVEWSVLIGTSWRDDLGYGFARLCERLGVIYDLRVATEQEVQDAAVRARRKLVRRAA